MALQMITFTEHHADEVTKKLHENNNNASLKEISCVTCLYRKFHVKCIIRNEILKYLNAFISGAPLGNTLICPCGNRVQYTILIAWWKYPVIPPNAFFSPLF